MYRSYDRMNTSRRDTVSSLNKARNKMNTYTISETQNVNSTREGTVIQAKNLTSAKRAANKAQYFQGTVLKVEQNGRLIAYKEDGVWTNV